MPRPIFERAKSARMRERRSSGARPRVLFNLI